MKAKSLINRITVYPKSIIWSKVKKEGVIFPRAFAIAIDDMGWNYGSNIGENGEPGPYRIGLNKKMGINDYKAIVNVGKKVGARIQGLFVLCEMDRNNTCAKYPTTTMFGEDWDNSGNVCDEQIEIMDYVRNQAAHLEFGMHGVGHEFWPAKNKKVRAEWYNFEEKESWPEEELIKHIECFKEIMAQYGLTPENGHSFPESFVPCACAYYWNPNGKYSLGSLLHKNGAKYANTLFPLIAELSPPQEPNGGGFDQGLHVINRLNWGNDWWCLSSLPSEPIENQTTDIVESHWANWLAQDSFLQNEVTQKFIDYYKQVQAYPTRYIAKNTEQLHSQWLYNKYTTITETSPGNVLIDNSKMPDEVYAYNIISCLVLKIKLESNQHISFALLNSNSICSYFEEAGYAFLYLPPLQQQTYSLKYNIGTEYMTEYIFNDGTYNVYSFFKEYNKIKMNIKVYGHQLVKIKCRNPVSAHSTNKNLKIIGMSYSEEQNMATVELKARNFQGEISDLILNF